MSRELRQITYRAVCPECRLAQYESQEEIEGCEPPNLPVIVFNCECGCSFQIQFQVEEWDDTFPPSIDDTESVIKSGKKELTGREGKVTNIVKKKDMYELLNAFQDFEDLDRTGILKTPSAGRRIWLEYKEMTGQEIGFTHIKADIASELVRRYISNNIDLRARIREMSDILDCSCVKEGNVL